MSGLRDALGYWMVRTDRTGYMVWFALSLIFAAVGGGVALSEAFSAPFVIQDDARRHSDPKNLPGVFRLSPLLGAKRSYIASNVSDVSASPRSAAQVGRRVPCPHPQTR